MLYIFRNNTQLIAFCVYQLIFTVFNKVCHLPYGRINPLCKIITDKKINYKEKSNQINQALTESNNRLQVVQDNISANMQELQELDNNIAQSQEELNTINTNINDLVKQINQHKEK